MKGGIAKVATAVAAGALVLTSCGGGDATAWANDLCGDIAPEVEELKEQPKIDQADPAAMKSSLTAFLDKVSAGIDTISGALDDAGEPPVDGGAEAMDKVSEALGTAKEAIGRAKTSIEGADPANPTQFQEAITKAGQEMQSLSSIGDPTEGLKANDELNKAFKEAESCKPLQ